MWSVYRRGFQLIAPSLLLLITQNNPALAGEHRKLSSNDVIPLSAFGERASFSPDGRKIVFVGKNYGDAYEIEVATRKMRNITRDIPHHGIHRIQYLPSGDFLVTAPRQYSGPNTRAHLEMWILDQSLEQGLKPLGEKPLEGIAISRQQNRIAWVAVEPAVELKKGEPWQLLFSKPTKRYTADIVYDGGAPHIVNKQEVMTVLPKECSFIEPQDFRNNDAELLFSCLKFSGKGGMLVSVMGYNIRSRNTVVYRSQPGEYNEIEGAAPDGTWTTVECGDQTVPGVPPLDICRLELKPNGKAERLFSGTPKGEMGEISNPVVSPDGKWVAFQKSSADAAEYGEGLGLFLVQVAD